MKDPELDKGIHVQRESAAHGLCPALRGTTRSLSKQPTALYFLTVILSVKSHRRTTLSCIFCIHAVYLVLFGIQKTVDNMYRTGWTFRGFFIFWLFLSIFFYFQGYIHLYIIY